MAPVSLAWPPVCGKEDEEEAAEAALLDPEVADEDPAVLPLALEAEAEPLAELAEELDTLELLTDGVSLVVEALESLVAALALSVLVATEAAVAEPSVASLITEEEAELATLLWLSAWLEAEVAALIALTVAEVASLVALLEALESLATTAAEAAALVTADEALPLSEAAVLEALATVALVAALVLVSVFWTGTMFFIFSFLLNKTT